MVRNEERKAGNQESVGKRLRDRRIERGDERLQKIMKKRGKKEIPVRHKTKQACRRCLLKTKSGIMKNHHSFDSNLML